MRARLLLTLLLALCSLAHAQTYYVPPGVTTIRAMVVGGTPLQGGAPQYWRDYCAAHRVGLAQSLADLPAVATASGHPEIVNAPIVTIGTSAGASAAAATAIANPTRAIAVVGLHGVMLAAGNDGFNANRSGENGDFPTLDFSGAYGIPMIYNFDNNDGFINPVVLQGLVEWGRAHGAPWTFFIHNDGNHTDNDTALNTMIFPWLTSVLDLRVPTSGAAADGTVTLIPIVEANGWLGNIKTGVSSSFASYPGDRTKADWFPSQSVATIWSGYHFLPTYNIPAQPIVAPTGIVADLTILDPINNDTTSGTGWKINANLKEADQAGSLVKYFLLAPPPASVAGLDWIRPITPGKNYVAYTADPIFTFRVTADATVFIAHSDTAATRPAWLSTYTNTGEQLVVTSGNLNANAPRYTLFKKDFAANAIVTCGTNAPANSGQMYLTIVKPLGAPALPSVSVNASDASATESGDTGAFTITRTGATTSALTVNFSVSGTAVSGADFASLGTGVSLPAGQSSAVVTVATLQDTTVETTETVVLTLAADAAYNLGSPTAATVSVLDDDAPPQPVVTVADTLSTAAEPGTAGQFTISRTGATTSALTVNFTMSGSATGGTDYTSLGTSAVIPAGQGSVALAVTPIDDTLVEGTETVTLSIASSATYALGTITVASVNITDNDTSSLPVVTITASQPNAAEPGTNGVLTVTRTGATTSALAVTFNFTGTATRAVDYTVSGASGTTLNIPAGQASANITVVVVNDTLVEGTETAICTIAANAAYTLGSPANATVSIADDDGGTGVPAVTIAATNTNAAEPSTSGTFTVTRTGATTSALTVNFAVTGTATSGTDFTALGTSVSIPVGQASATITVTPIDDTMAESSETVIVTLSANAAYTLGSPSAATVNIADNDSGGSGSTVTVAATIADAAEPVTNGRFTFTRTTPTTSALTVNFTVSGTATSGVDYTALGTSVTIAANQTTAILNVVPIDDGLIESSETVIVTIAANAGYIVGSPASATVNLADNDADVPWVMTGNGVTYATHGANTVKLDIYQPKTLPAAPMPVFIWIPGGGWSSVTRSNITDNYRAYVNDGFAVVCIDHTNSGTGKWPIQIQDCKAAVRWLRANAVAYNLDPTRIAVAGSSSGGHMAAMVGTTGGVRYVTVGSTTMDFVGSDAANLEFSDAVQAAIPVMPPTHLLWMDHYFTSTIPDHDLINSPESQLFGFPIQTIPEQVATANPLLHISASTPPFFITQGTADTYVPFNQSELLNHALVRAGRSSTYWATVGGGHDGSTREAAENVLLIQQFLKRTILGNASNALPVASFTASATSGPAPLSVNFNGGASSDSDGTVTKYAWSFGDDLGANGATTSYTYNTPGTYPVTLCVRDNLGASASVTQTITVLATPPASGTPPAVAVNTPAQGLVLTRPANTLVEANVTDSDGTVVTVEFILNGVSAGFDTVAPYNFSWGNLAAGTHTVSVRGYDSSGNTTLTPTPTTFTVQDGTLPVVSIVATNPNAAEPSTSGTFTVTRTWATTNALAVNYTLGGTAVNGTDYTTLGGIANIAAGQATATITVAPMDDAAQESSETVIATLSANAAYTLGSPSAATVNIADNDTGGGVPTVTISSSDSAAAETSSGNANTGSVTITRDGATTSALTVQLAYGGTSTNGADYATLPASATIASGAATATLTLTPTDDGLVEGLETASISIVASAAYTRGTPSGVGININDNDNATPITTEGIVFATHGSGTNTRDVKLNVYLPATGSGPWPVVIYYPGGGWSVQTESAITPLFTDWTASGYAVISANYITSSFEKWPAQIRDAKAAVRWVRANAATYGFDPTRIGVTGGSSGAHIAAYVALSSGVKTVRVVSEVMDLVGTVGGNLSQSDVVHAAAPMFAPTDLLVMDHYPTPGVADHNAANSPESGLIGAAIQTVPEKTATANPLIHIRPGVPPIWITAGTADALVDFNQSELLNAALVKAAQPVTFWPVQGGGHGPGVSDSQEVIGLVKAFFDRIFLGTAPNALPVPAFTASTLTGPAPLTVSFDGGTSTDSDGTITKYSWANGDDTGMGASATASYTFTRPGIYPVCLAVRDDAGGSASITKNIVVTPAASGGANPPTIALTAPTDGFLVARPGNLMATVDAAAASGTIASVEFFLNDQHYAWDSKAPYNFTLSALLPGRYRLSARASDSTGNSTTSSAVNFRVLAPEDAEPQPSIGSGLLSITYFRFTDGTVAYANQRSSDLAGWTSFAPTELTLQTFPSIEVRKVTDPLPIGTDTKRFLRLQITAL